jgi:uncharacterized protein YbjT (DUF2867 family)
MTYAIAGVTGNTGRVVAETLLEAGKKVRVIVRDAAKGESWRARGAEVAVADLTDREALARALAGADAAYLLLPPDYASRDAISDNARRTESIGFAIAKARIPHVVFLSSIGGQHASGTGPIKALHHAERRLPELAPEARFTWLRPAYFMENAGSVVAVAREQGVLPSMFDPGLRVPMIATADIGRAAAAALIEGPREGRASIVELAGPREVSYDDLAAELSTLLGKAVTTVHVPREGVKGALMQAGLGEDLAQLAR